MSEAGSRGDVVELRGGGPSEADSRSISDELLAAFMSLMPDAAVAVDTDGTIVAANPQAEALFAYPTGALVGLAIETLVPERARTRHRSHRSSFMSAPEVRGMGAELELAGRRRDGQEFPVDISLAPIAGARNELVVAAVRDLTEKQAANTAQAELASIVRSSLDAIMSTTIQGHITSWNPAAELLFGYDREEILGQHITTLVPPESSPVLEQLYELAQAANRGALDTSWRHRDGHDIDVAVSISPLRDRSGTLLGFSSLVRDIGKRKRDENELRRLLAEEERLERQHSVTAEIRLAFLSDISLEEAVRLVCERGAELLDAPVTAISITDGEDLRVLAATGAAAPLVGTTMPAEHSFVERVVRTGQQVQAARRTDDPYPTAPPSLPDGAVLGVPILIGGSATAAFTAVKEIDAGEFTQADLVVAENLAAQTALAFELQRARQDREQIVLVGDRERIARDLHDHVIQQLFATGMTLQSTLPLIERPLAAERVTDAIDSLDETIREIRNTIYNLSQPLPGVQQLRAQILELLQVAEESLGFAPSVRFDGPVDVAVPRHIVPEVMAVVREALSNAARHARAHEVSVRIELNGGSLYVAVADDGIGARNSERSSGLANLEQRAVLLGGRFDLTVPDVGGTILEWVVPVRD